MRLDAASSIPMFQQIADGVRAAVASRAYRSGEAIPSIREMAQRLLVNPNTVKRAYEELEREGLLVARQGLGMFVAENTAAGARSRTAGAVQGAFGQGIALGRSAELTREQIDGAYARAWKEQGGRNGSGA